MRDFRNLNVWHKSHGFVLGLYRATASFPKHEGYGLTSQMRRAAVSIPSNIAEGCGRTSTAEFERFLTITTGSASECEYQLLLARDLGYLPDAQYLELVGSVIEIKRMATSLTQKLRK